MDFDLLLAAQLYLFCIFVACAFVFQRLRWRHRLRRGKKNLGFYPSSTSLGNALHQLQSIAEPPIKYVIAESMDEDVDEQYSGDQNDPKRHLLKQIARIRRGEYLERLTARVSK